MPSLDELLKVDEPRESLVQDLVLLFEGLCLHSTATAIGPALHHFFVCKQVFDDRAQLKQLLVDGVHEEAELLLNLLLRGRLAHDLPSLSVPHVKELSDHFHLVHALPASHVRSRPWQHLG